MTKVVGSLFGASAPKFTPQPLPEMPKVEAIPVADEAALRKARSQTAAAAIARGGRTSTMLSDAGSSGDKLG